MIPAAGFALAALLFGAIAMGRATWLKAGAFLAAMVCIVLATVQATGLPRPLWAAYPKPERVVLLGVVLQEPEAIFVWTRRGADAPIAYQLPWNAKTAEQAREAMRQSHEMHRPAMWSANGHGAGGGNGHGGRPGGSQGAGATGAGNGTGQAGQGAYAGGAARFWLAPVPALPPKAAGE